MGSAFVSFVLCASVLYSYRPGLLSFLMLNIHWIMSQKLKKITYIKLISLLYNSAEIINSFSQALYILLPYLVEISFKIIIIFINSKGRHA